MKKNIFFENAFSKATSIAGRRERLLQLVTRAFQKARGVDWSNTNALSAKSRMMAFGRLCKAYALGEYRDIPWKTMLLVVAAVLYFVNPLDLLPDIIPITGLTDDFAILLWVYGSIRQEIEKFLEWERSRLPVR